MKANRLVVTAILGGSIVTSAPGLAQTTSPGKNAVFVAGSFGPLPLATNTLLSGTIVKGKAKRVLAIEGMFTTGFGPAVGDVVLLGARVDTISGTLAVLPPDAGVRCTFGQQCTITGTFWLDLDEAEANNPGTVVGQPLTVRLVGGVVGAPPENGDLTMTVRMQKK